MALTRLFISVMPQAEVRTDEVGFKVLTNHAQGLTVLPSFSTLEKLKEFMGTSIEPYDALSFNNERTIQAVLQYATKRGWVVALDPYFKNAGLTSDGVKGDLITTIILNPTESQGQ
jgi:hypothetical protein